MKKRRNVIRTLLCMLLLSCLCFSGISPVQAQEGSRNIQKDTPEELNQLYARSAVLMDADSGRILFEKNGYEQMPMASTTKIMTCILALELGDLDAEVKVSDRAASQPEVHLGMAEGQSFLLRDLLYSLMLESHNDSAVAIAEHISGSVESFAQLMNRKAQSIGLKQTHFVTPNGLDASDGAGAHSISAADLAAVMKYCIRDSPQRDLFLEITQTQEHSFSDVGGTGRYSCRNHNAFLGMMEGALSGKTGFTAEAGYCYVGALEDNGRCFIVALLACGWPGHKEYKWKDTEKLMRYGLEHYQYRDVWEEFSPRKLPVEDGADEKTGLFETACVTVKAKTERKEYPVLLSDREEVQVSLQLESRLTAPVQKGVKVGQIRYELDGKTLSVIPIVTDEAVSRREYDWVLRRIFGWYLPGRPAETQTKNKKDQLN